MNVSSESLRTTAIPSSIAHRTEDFSTDALSLQSRLHQALSEREQLKQEIEKLNARLTSRMNLLLEPRERLMREEYERKFQDLTVNLRAAHSKYRRKLEELKNEKSLCICQTNRG